MRRILAQREEAVSPIVAEILLVAMTVTLAASVYYLSSSLSSQSLPNKPFIEFGPVSLEGGNATFAVGSASRGVSAANYRVNLMVGGEAGTAVGLGVSGTPRSMSVGGSAYEIAWTDIGGDGSLSAGDTFQVRGTGAPLPRGTAFHFFLLWSDGSSVQSTSWNA